MASMPRALPVHRGYTVDERLQEFRMMQPDRKMEIIPFDSMKGRVMMKELEGVRAKKTRLSTVITMYHSKLGEKVRTDDSEIQFFQEGLRIIEEITKILGDGPRTHEIKFQLTERILKEKQEISEMQALNRYLTDVNSKLMNQ